MGVKAGLKFRRNLFKGSVTSFRRKKVDSLYNSLLEMLGDQRALHC